MIPSPTFAAELADLRDRVAVLYISTREVMSILDLRKFNPDRPEQFTMPEWDLPRDAEVISVFLAPERQSFGFIIRSKSFDKIGTGSKMPEIEHLWSAVTVKGDVTPPPKKES